jgi:signal transduction histidine kinase
MKLATKSNLYFIITALFVFLVSAVIIYYLLLGIGQSELDKDLEEQRLAFLARLQAAGGFDHIAVPEDSSLIMSPVSYADTIIQEGILGDTLIPVYDFETAAYEPEPFRQLIFTAEYHGIKRSVTIRKSVIDSEDLILSILYSLAVVFVVMILSLLAVNMITVDRIWLPFRKILLQVKAFDFHEKQNFMRVPGNISEFNELNEALIRMTSKLSHDYFALKEFSENASHEMQTPLAIIQSKLELLMQQKISDETDLKTLNAAYQAVHRLSRLHNDLNLLTRIENQEFTERKPIQLKSLIKNQIESFSDIIEMKNLSLETDFKSDPDIQGNIYLLEIMLSNLFSNAISHNLERGHINLELTQNSFTMANSGDEPQLPPERLFERFRKGKSNSASTGLGLALVKQICLLHGFTIQYTFGNQLHTIQIRF